MRIILVVVLFLLSGNVVFSEENERQRSLEPPQGTIEGRATISGRWAKLHITGNVADAAYTQMPFPVVEGTSSMNTPGQSKGFPGFACTKYRLPNAEYDNHECFALVSLKKGKLVDAVFSDAEPEDDETEERLTAYWDALGNKSPRAPDIHEVIRDPNSQEWRFDEEVTEENEELEGFDYIRGKIGGQAMVARGWIDFYLAGDIADAIYYQLPSSIKNDAKYADGRQTRGFPGFICTKYQVYDSEKYDYKCMVSINLNEGVIESHN